MYKKKIYFPFVTLVHDNPNCFIGRLIPIQYIDGIKNLYQKDLDITYEIFHLKRMDYNFIAYSKFKSTTLHEFTQYKEVLFLLDNYYSNNNLLDNIEDNLTEQEIEFFKEIYNKFSNKLDYDYVFMSCFELYLFPYIYIILLLNKYNPNIKIVIGGPATLSDNVNNFLLELSNNIFIRPGDLENVIIELFNNNLEEEKLKLDYFNFNDYPDYMPIYNQDSLDFIRKYRIDFVNVINYEFKNIIYLTFSRACRYQCEFCICTAYPAGFSHLSGDKIEYLLEYNNNNNNLWFSDNSVLNYKDEFINHFNTDLKLGLYLDFKRIDNSSCLVA
jgi:hypothetical protein